MRFPFSRLCFTGLLFALWCGPLHAGPFRDCGICPEMVIVPAGEFMMGSPPDEGGIADERPRHRVRIKKPFANSPFEAVEFATLEWVDWFNTKRLLEPIGNIPPAEAEARHHAQSPVTPWRRDPNFNVSGKPGAVQ